MYNEPFYITENVSNNSFSFAKRKNPRIYVADVIDGGLEDVRLGDEVVFEDVDEDGKLKSCTGLKHFVRMAHPVTGKPIVVVDNHNHVFYFWHEARNKGLITNNATLIHMDQHKDTREPESYISKKESEDLEKVFEYTNTVLNVGNYIPPAIRDGLVGDVINITGENELSSRFQTHKPIILNIDLDFWAPEMSYIDDELKVRRTKEWMACADFITIATSPFFMDQNTAIKILGELF